MWQGWASIILGFWLIISSVIPELQIPINLVVTGILSLISGILGFRYWMGRYNTFLGFWILICGLTNHLITPINFLIVGILMALLSLGSEINYVEDLIQNRIR